MYSCANLPFFFRLSIHKVQQKLAGKYKIPIYGEIESNTPKQKSEEFGNKKNNAYLCPMKQTIVYNLTDFAAKYLLHDIFGAYAAHLMVSDTSPEYFSEDSDRAFVKMVRERTLFTKLMLTLQGHCQMQLPDRPTLSLKAGDFLIVTAQETASISQMSQDFEAECILVDEHFADKATLFHLKDDKLKSVTDIFHFVRDIVRHKYINKVEMIKSMFNVLQLIIDELPYEQCPITHDLKHKKEIYEIFLHHLYRHFRQERQIRFYADKLNISTAYLSRLVKEISGSTVNDHVTSLVYKEICNLLKQSDMTMGEIADHLHFSDQSAMSNFFKQRSGMSPLAYRNQAK